MGWQGRGTRGGGRRRGVVGCGGGFRDLSLGRMWVSKKGEVGGRGQKNWMAGVGGLDGR